MSAACCQTSRGDVQELIYPVVRFNSIVNLTSFMVTLCSGAAVKQFKF